MYTPTAPESQAISAEIRHNTNTLHFHPFPLLIFVP